MTDTPDPDTCTLSEDELQLLGRLDERTEQIDSKVDEVVDSTDMNAERISANRRRIKRNATILGGYSAGLMALLMWGADKITRIL
jgi:predicted esterase